MRTKATTLEVGDDFVMSPGAGFGRSARRGVIVAAVDRRPYTVVITDQNGDRITLDNDTYLKVLRS